MAEGEFALVRQHLETALTLSGEWVGDHDLYVRLADVASRQRDEDAVRHYAPLAEEAAVRYDHKLFQAVSHRAWGVAHTLAGEFDEAKTHLGQALELFQSLDTHWQIGHTWFEFGELARARSDGAAARDCFTRALVAFKAMRAGPDAARTREAMESLS